MKDSYGTIKQRAKTRLSTNFGDAFLILLVPWLIVAVINWITGRIFPIDPEELFTTNYIINQIISYILGIYSGYIVIRLILPYVRGKNGITFEGFFQFDAKFLQYSIYQIIIVVIQFAIGLRPLQLTPKVLDELRFNFETSDDILDILQNPIFQEWVNAILVSVLLSLVFWVVLVKLRLVPYIIIDQGKNFSEAISMSWEMTNGNFLRILFFPLAFILWFLLVLITCGLGIVYVAPLYTAAQAFLYLSILKENGYDDGFEEIVYETKQVDPLDNFYE